MSSKEIDEFVNQIKKSNEEYNLKFENIRLTNLVEELRLENLKIPKSKELIIDYKKILKEKESEIEFLKRQDRILQENIQKIPKFIKIIFLNNK